jgi:ammonia channel protein AmtB
MEFALFVRPGNGSSGIDLENMKSNTPLHAIGVAALLLFTAFGFNGCNEIEDTVAVVYVQNSLGAPVQGAEVRLFAVGSSNQTVIGELRFDTTQVTNAAGSVSFNFSEYYKQGQAGFAVLDIEATKGSLEGIGIIKIEEEMTNEQTVIME